MYDPTNPELREQYHAGFIKGVETSPSFPRHPDTDGQEDEMTAQIHDAVERGFMDAIEGEDLYLSWIANRTEPRQPQVRQIQTEVARPFYE